MTHASTLAVLALLAAPALAHAQAGDRYGPAPAAYASSPYAGGYGPAAPPPMRGRVLSWPGKASALQAPAAPAPAAYPAPAGVRAAYAPRPASPAFGPPSYGRAAAAPSSFAGPPMRQAYAAPRPQRAYPPPAVAPSPDAAQGWRSHQAVAAPPMAAPPADGWRSVYPQAAMDAPRAELAGAPQASRPAPTSIYAAPAREADPVAARVAAAPPPRGTPADRRYGYDPSAQHSVRFYSVSRPFGLKPDPAPIPPQFFANTADLSDPPGPLPLERSGTAVTSAGRTVRAAPDTSTN